MCVGVRCQVESDISLRVVFVIVFWLYLWVCAMIVCVALVSFDNGPSSGDPLYKHLVDTILLLCA